MASPQLENGYTRIANELLEATAKFPFNGSQLRMILFLWRKTYGFQKTVDKISISQWAEGTKLSQRTICRELKNLLKMNVIQREKDE
jgi:phage replication O-like protein O